MKGNSPKTGRNLIKNLQKEGYSIKWIERTPFFDPLFRTHPLPPPSPNSLWGERKEGKEAPPPAFEFGKEKEKTSIHLVSLSLEEEEEGENFSP